jgi:hypothetical protein
MSLTLSIKGSTSTQWTLSTESLGDIERVRSPLTDQDVTVIFGDPTVQAGTSRTVERELLAAAISRLIVAAKSLPGVFEVIAPSFFINGVEIPMRGGRGAAVVMSGTLHIISCVLNHWTLQTKDDFLAGKLPEPRYSPAHLYDEQRGATVAVQPKPSGRSELEKLLRKMKPVVAKDDSKTMQIVWG